jgi:hypothetical protein
MLYLSRNTLYVFQYKKEGPFFHHTGTQIIHSAGLSDESIKLEIMSFLPFLMNSYEFIYSHLKSHHNKYSRKWLTD